MPFVKYNDLHEIVAVSEFPQYNFEYIEKLPKEYLEKQQVLEDNMKYRGLLDRSDWKVTRQRDQKAAGGKPSLTQKEYKTLLDQRQTWRDDVKKIYSKE